MYKIGVDLGGTNIGCGLVDEIGQFMYKDHVKTPRAAEPKVVIEEITKICKKAIAENNLTNQDIRYIGIGIPGIVDDETGIVKYAPNLKFKNVDLRKIFSELLDIPVYLENDANAAALGESLLEHVEEYKSIVFVALGTGVGVGVVINNQLVTGNIEAGHMTIDPNGPTCSCGNRGCFESFCSATALINFAKEAVANDQTSKILDIVQGDINKIEAKTIFDAYYIGDDSATNIVNQYIKHLAIGVNNLINAYPVKAVIVGGGVSGQGDKLLSPLITELEKMALGGSLSAKIFTARLGNDAGIIGAAHLK